jgi:hypothetical protein
VWEPAAATPEGIYTYRIRAAHDEEGGCDDQDKSRWLTVDVENFYWFERDAENGKLRGFVRYGLNRAAAQVQIKFYDHELNEVGQVACPELSAGGHFSDVYAITLPYDQDGNLIQPVYCVAFATETAQDGALNRDGQPKPALPRGSSGLQEVSGSVSAEGAYSVPPDPLPEGADLDILHFVTPKGGANDVVTLTATLQPQGLEDVVEWEGATQDPENPLIATVSKGSAAKHEIRLKLGGTVHKDIGVWVVWASGHTELPGCAWYYDDEAKATVVYLTSFQRTTFTINPATIIESTNRPNLRGLATVAPPDVPAGETSVWHAGLSLARGIYWRWDPSRRQRKLVVNESGVDLSGHLCACCGQPTLLTKPDWPSLLVTGNDDRGLVGERGDPYHPEYRGRLVQQDAPRHGLLQGVGAVGDEVEIVWQFEDFARLQVAGSWHVISDGMPWTFYSRFVKADEHWVPFVCEVSGGHTHWKE